MSATNPELSAVRPAPGMTVASRFNESWGAGTVMALQGDSARVLFTSHPSKKPVLVPCKSLVITRAGNWDAAAATARQAERAKASPSSASAKKKKASSTTTQDEAGAPLPEAGSGRLPE